MKNIKLACAISIMLGFLVLNSCKKMTVAEDEYRFSSPNEERDWFYEHYNQDLKYFSTKKNSNLILSDYATHKKLKESKIPNWSTKRSYKLNSLEILEYDLVYSIRQLDVPTSLKSKYEIERYKENVKSKVLFIKNQNSYDLRVITFLPDVDLLKDKKLVASELSLNNVPSTFKGFIVVSNWDNKYLKGYRVEAGKIVGQLFISDSNLSSTNAKDPNSKTNQTYFGAPCVLISQTNRYAEICTALYSQSDVFYADFCAEIDLGTTMNFNYSDCITDVGIDYSGCDDLSTPYNDCYTSGESFLALNQRNYNLEINSTLTSPCFVNAFARIQDVQIVERNGDVLTNELAAFIQIKFGGTTKWDLGLEVKEGPIPIAPDGSRTDAKTDFGPSGNAVIKINTDLLTSNASQEYVIVSFLHEFIHAIIQQPKESLAHNTIANDYINSMANALQAYFPNLSRSDAEGLAWGGLAGTTAWSNLTSAQKNQIVAINTSYRTGASGSPCN